MEWHDREAELLKKYLLTYFTVDGTVEIVSYKHHQPIKGFIKCLHVTFQIDLIRKCRFLKRMKLTTVTPEELYIGNVLNIYSRPMTIIEYGDSCTFQYLDPKTERYKLKYVFIMY